MNWGEGGENFRIIDARRGILTSVNLGFLSKVRGKFICWKDGGIDSGKGIRKLINGWNRNFGHRDKN